MTATKQRRPVSTKPPAATRGSGAHDRRRRTRGRGSGTGPGAGRARSALGSLRRGVGALLGTARVGILSLLGHLDPRRWIRHLRRGSIDLREPARPKPGHRGEPADGARPDAPEVHPRIARRRAEVRRQSRSPRRLLRWLPIVFAVGATALVAALFSPLVDLDHLEVVGLEGEPEARVREVVALDAGTALFGIRPAEVRARVESIPWVVHADVDVRWPDRVVVEATPHRPVALLHRSAGEQAVLTASGERLTRDEAGPLWAWAENTPELHLPPGAGVALREDAVTLLTQLRPVTTSMLEEVDLDDSGTVGLVLTVPGVDAPVEVYMGAPEELPAKAMALDAVLGGAVQTACMERVDVSVPTRVTVLRSDGCTVPDPDDGVDD